MRDFLGGIGRLVILLLLVVAPFLGVLTAIAFLAPRGPR